MNDISMKPAGILFFLCGPNSPPYTTILTWLRDKSVLGIVAFNLIVETFFIYCVLAFHLFLCHRTIPIILMNLRNFEVNNFSSSSSLLGENLLQITCKWFEIFKTSRISLNEALRKFVMILEITLFLVEFLARNLPHSFKTTIAFVKRGLSASSWIRVVLFISSLPEIMTLSFIRTPSGLPCF